MTKYSTDLEKFVNCVTVLELSVSLNFDVNIIFWERFMTLACRFFLKKGVINSMENSHER